MLYSDKWKDYKLLDATSGERLERWGKYVLVRPDPQVLWKSEKKVPEWDRPDAVYRRSRSGGGAWSENSLPSEWTISYQPLGMKMKVRPMGFKHTGVFPEQAVNWEFMYNKIKSSSTDIKVLNLFAYSGLASVACAKAGAFVCHVDASKGMVSLAKENAALSSIPGDRIRYIVDDCRKFVCREIRRGVKYDAVVMDPPSYGRGPTGEVWSIEDNIYDLIKTVSGVLISKPLFVLINSYTTGLSPSVMKYIVSEIFPSDEDVSITCGEIGIPVASSTLALPCGAVCRYESNA